MEENWSACLLVLEGHTAKIRCVRFSPDGKLLASVSSDATVKVWEVITGKCVRTLKVHGHNVESVAFSSSGKYLASLELRKIIIWNAVSGKILHTIIGHFTQISWSHPEKSPLAFSYDSEFLVVMSARHSLEIWKIVTDNCSRIVERHIGQSEVLALSLNGEYFASAEIGQARVWGVHSGKCLQTFECGTDTVREMVFSPNGKRVAFIVREETRILDSLSGECLQKFRHEVSSYGYPKISFSNDGLRLAYWSTSWWRTNPPRILDVLSGEDLQTLPLTKVPADTIELSPNGRLLASISNDVAIRVWDVSERKGLGKFGGHSDPNQTIAFSPDTTRAVSVSIKSKILQVWDVINAKCLHTLQGHHAEIFSFDISRNSMFVASGSRDTTVRIWELSHGRCLHILKGHTGLIQEVLFSQSNRRLASISRESGGYEKKTKYEIRIWDVVSGQCLSILRGSAANTLCSAIFSTDSKLLVCYFYEDSTKIWDTISGACLQTIEHRRSSSLYNLVSIGLSHDNKWLACESNNFMVDVWDVSSGKNIKQCAGHVSEITSICFSYDHKYLASSSLDETIKVWDMTDSKCLQTIDVGGRILHLSFDVASSYLHTEMGVFSLDLAVTSTSVNNEANSKKPQQQGYGLSADSTWITHNSEKLVWLPAEYQSQDLHLSGSTVILGIKSGRLLNMSFVESEELLRQLELQKSQSTCENHSQGQMQSEEELIRTVIEL
ncbi:MAG: hypothetical protein Q9191_004659 [Dirinaria sp. TL-2023a]